MVGINTGLATLAAGITAGVIKGMLAIALAGGIDQELFRSRFPGQRLLPFCC